MNKQTTDLLILSGDIEKGKTRICMRVAEGLKARGRDVAGVVSPAVWKGSEKIAIESLDLRSGESRRLADRTDQAEGSTGPQTKRWQFNAETLAWCNQVYHAIESCDHLIVDELGPLEFEREEGLLAAFDVLDRGDYQCALVVIRPSLLVQAEQRWPLAKVFKIEEPGQETVLSEKILDILDSSGSTHTHE
jgi:nucleoside-triphosphatase THEP1